MDHQKGQISPGCDADLICWDPDASFIVKPSMINFKNKLTPYEDEKLFGVVKKTFLRGEKVYENGKFLKAPFGKTLMRKNGN
jgi:allantoinase